MPVRVADVRAQFIAPASAARRVKDRATGPEPRFRGRGARPAQAGRVGGGKAKAGEDDVPPSRIGKGARGLGQSAFVVPLLSVG